MNTLCKYGLATMISVIIGITAPAEPANVSTNKPAPIISIFIIPTSPGQGRDPFFPESTRLYQNAAAPVHKTAKFADLTIKGVSTQDGTPMVIINNHTFAAGDEEDVITSNGRVHVHCLEIQQGGVIVEVNGQRRELHFQSN